jgi:hypothetical protein
MIEMLILSMILAKVVQNGVVDISFAVRGKPSPRYAAAQKRSWRPSGAAARYFGQLWQDSWADALEKHNTRRTNATTKTPRTRSAAGRFFAGIAQDKRRAVRRSWDERWERADEKRREKTTRPRPGQETVPGQVVPNAQDEDRPQDGDGDRPEPDPQPVPAEDGTTDQDEPIVQPDPSQRDCRNCTPDRHWHDQYCLVVGDDLWIGEDEQDEQDGPDFGPDQDISPTARPTTEEGPTMTTMPTTEVVGLESAIRFCEDSSQAYTAMVYSIEQTRAALANGDVSGPAADAFDQAMEMSAAASAAMVTAAEEMKKHRVVAEAYDAVPGAGTREFVRAGR